MKRLDLIGRRYGRWLVVAAAPRTYQTMWECRCDCGTKRNVSGANLTSGHSTSCGCFREENRPNLVLNRDNRGDKNPRAQLNMRKYGTNYVPSSSVWYKRASGVFYAARKNNVPVGFSSVVELAAYVRSIAPKKCPVFGEKFVERGNGFDRWSPSIDKINPKKGYVRGNIQVISVFANAMKRDASPRELRKFASWVLRK